MGSKDYKVKNLTVDGNAGIGTDDPLSRISATDTDPTIYSPGTQPPSLMRLANLDQTAGAVAIQLLSVAGSAGTGVMYHGFVGGGSDSTGYYVLGFRQHPIYVEALRIEAGGLATFAGTVQITGDLDFSGAGSGLFYGECYGGGMEWEQEEAVQNQWYPISDGDMLSGDLHNVTHDGGGELTLASAGVYRVAWHIVAESNSANEHIHVGLEVNSSGTPVACSIDHNETKFVNVHTQLGKTCLITVAAGQTISAMITTVGGGLPNLSVTNLNIVVEKIGG